MDLAKLGNEGAEGSGDRISSTEGQTVNKVGFAGSAFCCERHHKRAGVATFLQPLFMGTEMWNAYHCPPVMKCTRHITTGTGLPLPHFIGRKKKFRVCSGQEGNAQPGAGSQGSYHIVLPLL